MVARVACLLLCAALSIPAGARAQIPPPYPSPPPYPAYPDPGPTPSAAPWPSGGISICSAPGEQGALSGTDDYAHGAYFAWSDHRGADFDVYTIRIGPDGQPLPGWTTNGNLIAGGAGDQTCVACVNDGPWGTYVVWLDYSSGSPEAFVQKLTPTGTIAAGWPSGGIPLCTSATQTQVWVFPDHQGGLQFMWLGTRTGDTYVSANAYHMKSDGTAFAGWPDCGVEAMSVYNNTGACGTFNSATLYYPASCWPDGIFYCRNWRYLYCEFYDPCQSCRYYRCGASESFVGPGLTQTEDGGTCGTFQFQQDEAGGFLDINYSFGGIVSRTGVLGNPSWTRTIAASAPIFPAGDGSFFVKTYPGVLRLMNDGSNAWPSAVAFCDPPCSPAYDATLGTPDGSGGLYLSWLDLQSNQASIYATLVLSSGTRGAGWPARGFPIAVGAANAQLGALIGDRRGSAIVAWRDDRRGEYDLYAYRLTTDQPVPVLASLISTSASAARVEIVWYVPTNPGAMSVERREVDGPWQRIADAMRDGSSHVRVIDSDIRPGTRYEYQLRSASGTLGDVFIDVPVAPALAFEGARPNPAANGLEVSFTLPDDGPAILRLRDISGRTIITRELGSPGAGAHTISLTRTGDLVPGVYFVELEAGESRMVRRAVVIR